MPSFLIKGKDWNKVERAVRVDAENGSSARATLAAQGWTELNLLTCELGDVASRTVESPEEFKDVCKAEITPELEAACIEGKAPSFAQQWMNSIRDSSGSIAFVAVLLLLGVYLRLPIVIWLSGGLILFLVFLTPAISFYFGLPLRYYDRLNKAKVWARWDEVLLCVNRLEQLRRVHYIGPGPLELVRCRAQALAGKGRLEEGLALFTLFENSPEIPRWFYLSQLSTIYNTAGDFEKFVELNTQVLELKPDSSIFWLEQSCALSRRTGRVAEAQEALSRVKLDDLPALGRLHVHVAHGLVAWRTGQLTEAKEHFEKALKGFVALKHLPLIESCIYMTKADLCAVHGAMGRRNQAAQLFKEVERFLIAHKEEELLKACREGLGTCRV